MRQRNLHRRWVSGPVYLAVGVLAWLLLPWPLHAADTPTAGAEQEAAVARYVLFGEIRVEQVATSLKEFHAAMTAGVPVAAALVQGEIYPLLTHTSSLTGVDGKQAIRWLFFLDGDALAGSWALPPDNGSVGMEWAHCVPLGRASDFLDELDLEQDDLTLENGYRHFTAKGAGAPTFLKVVDHVAVFSSSQRGVDLGLQALAVEAAAAKIAKPLAASAPPPTQPAAPRPCFTAEIRVQAVLQTLQRRTQQPFARGSEALTRRIIAGLEWIRENRPNGLEVKGDPKDIARLIAWATPQMDQLESVQLQVYLSARRAQMDLDLVAVPDSGFAECITRLKPVVMPAVRQVNGIAPAVVHTAHCNRDLKPLLSALLASLDTEVPGASALAGDLLTQFSGADATLMTYLSAPGEQFAVVEVTGIDGAHARDRLLGVLQQWVQLQQAAGRKQAACVGSTLPALGENKIESWQLNMDLPRQADAQDKVQVDLQSLARSFSDHRVQLTVCTQAQRLIVVAADKQATADRAMTAYLQTSATNLAWNPAWETELRKNMAASGTISVQTLDIGALFASSPVVRGRGNPEEKSAIAELLAEIRPITMAVGTAERRLIWSSALEPATVRNFMALAMSVGLQHVLNPVPLPPQVMEDEPDEEEDAMPPAAEGGDPAPTVGEQEY